jgi:hypothetical protein
MKKRRDNDPTYEAFDKKYRKVLKNCQVMSPAEMEDISKNEQTLNDKARCLYKEKLIRWEKASREIARGELLMAHNKIFLSGENEEIVDICSERLGKVHFSLKQRGKPAAGRALEDTIEFLLRRSGIFCEKPFKKADISKRKPDLIIKSFENDNKVLTLKDTLNVSCKGTYRDKENDKDYEVQICYRGEIPDKLLHYFFEHQSLLIIIDPEERKKTQIQITKCCADLITYDMDSGVKKLKEILIKNHKKENSEP